LSGRYGRERPGDGWGQAGLGARERVRPACQAVIAVAATATILAVHWPWFQATLRPIEPGSPVLMAPSGAATGLYAHQSLWVATGLAAAELIVLLAHYAPFCSPAHRLRLPGDVGGSLLAVTSGAILILAAADSLAPPGPWLRQLSPNGLPFPWEGRADPLDGGTLILTWRFGAAVTVAAGLTSLIAAVIVIFAERRRVLRARQPAALDGPAPNVGGAV
jgi:hypothetical protein